MDGPPSRGPVRCATLARDTRAPRRARTRHLSRSRPGAQSLPPSPPVPDDTQASGQLPQVLRHPPTSGDPKKTERPESIPADRPIDHHVAGHQAVHPDKPGRPRNDRTPRQAQTRTTTHLDLDNGPGSDKQDWQRARLLVGPSRRTEGAGETSAVPRGQQCPRSSAHWSSVRSPCHPTSAMFGSTDSQR